MLPELKCSLSTAHLESDSSEERYLKSMNYCILLSSDESVAQLTPWSSLQARESLFIREAMVRDMVQCKKGHEPAELRDNCRQLRISFSPLLFLSAVLLWTCIFSLHIRDELTHVNDYTTRIVNSEASSCVCLPSAARTDWCVGTNASTCEFRPCLSPREWLSMSSVPPQSENVLDSCKYCHMISECLLSSFLPTPNL